MITNRWVFKDIWDANIVETAIAGGLSREGLLGVANVSVIAITHDEAGIAPPAEEF